MITRTWRVYGADGHRQKVSFQTSKEYDFSGAYSRGTCIINLRCADMTGTHEYAEIAITADDFKKCEIELEGQLCDGIFENACVGKVVEIEVKE